MRIEPDAIAKPAPPALRIGHALRRFRALNRIKQTHLAETLGVSQATISRWERGDHEPSARQQAAAIDLIATAATSASDAALKRLIIHSSQPVHLICDATHRLLAASPAREASWRASASAFLGKGVWRFASDQIIRAEHRLPMLGWFERGPGAVFFQTGPNDADSDMRITPGILHWEKIMLADGSVGRIATTIARNAGGAAHWIETGGDR